MNRIRAWWLRRRYARLIMADAMDAGYPVSPQLVRRLIRLGQEAEAASLGGSEPGRWESSDGPDGRRLITWETELALELAEEDPAGELRV